MTFYTKCTAFVGSLAILGACSSPTNETALPGAPKTVSITQPHAATEVSVSYAQLATPMVQIEGSDVGVDENVWLRNGLLRFYHSDNSAGNPDYDFLAVTEQGEYSTYLVLSNRVPEDNSVGGAYVARFSQTDIPTTGEATLSGRYGGFLKYESSGGFDNGVYVVITGRTRLDIDFEDASFTGEIFDRDLKNYNSSASINTFPNVQNLMIVNGSFDEDGVLVAQTTGGDLGSVFNYVANDGSVDGVLAGPNANQAVGIVDVPHTNGTSDFRETGGFLVGE